MSFPTAAGVKVESGNFIPAIWSGKLQTKFYKATVLGEITNNDWEGEIKSQGDIVHIRTVPTITVRDYTKGQTLVHERPSSDPISLNIDKGKYFDFVIDDVDKAQADVNMMNMFSDDASEQMKIVIDAQVLGSVIADPDSANMGATAGAISANVNLGVTGTPVGVTKVNVLDFIVDAGQVLDEQNVPEAGRWLVIPPWMAAQIKKSDLKDASLTGDGASVLRNGRLGMIDRFTLYVSNNLTSAVDGSVRAFSMPFGTRDAICFASQMTKVETLRAESTFGDIVRGLNVYGFEVTNPKALGVLYGYKA
jgi:P22 coat protein - gene protein 5.